MTEPRPTPLRDGNSRLTEVALGVAVVALALAILAVELPDGEGSTSPAAYVAGVVAGIAIVFRRVYPLAILAVVAALRVAVMADIGNELALYPAVAVALYSAVRYGVRRIHLPIASAVGAVSAITISVLDPEPFLVEFVGEAALTAVPIALGDAARARRRRVENIIDTEADVRVQAERLRIARDLHDVVAHNLSIVTIQSGVASHLFDRDPTKAKEALDIINSAGKQSLEELRGMLGVLRSSDDMPLQPMPVEPTDIGELVATASASGLPVALETNGSFPADISNSVIVAAYRIIQEALNNVIRHAGLVATTVRLHHDDARVVVEVLNGPSTTTASPSLSPSTGVGIVGMTERAESLGGTLNIGRTHDGGHVVIALLPYHWNHQ